MRDLLKDILLRPLKFIVLVLSFLKHSLELNDPLNHTLEKELYMIRFLLFYASMEK